MATQPSAYARRAMERCDALGAVSEEAGRLTRRYGTPAMREANALVGGWMEAAGMTVRRDNVGNLVGRREAAGAGAPTLVLGSHLDTVRDAGRYDGPLGVMVALACVERLHDRGRRLPFGLELIGFADEEGTRFGATYLGSRAVAGTLGEAELGLTDPEGATLAEAIRAFGGDPQAIAEDRWRGGELLGYCEVHIEQGPVLEARGLPVGVVSGIAGQSRFEISWRGEAGHAGTVPMGLRRDALCAAAELVLGAERLAQKTPGLVATAGRISAVPGANNVIPARAEMGLDVRHPDDPVREAACRRLREAAEEIAARRRVELVWRELRQDPAVACSHRLSGLFERAVEERGLPVLRLASGAGHDAVSMAGLTGVAMLFVRCRGGISHHPAESVLAEDVAVAVEVLGRFLELL